MVRKNVSVQINATSVIRGRGCSAPGREPGKNYRYLTSFTSFARLCAIDCAKSITSFHPSLAHPKNPPHGIDRGLRAVGYEQQRPRPRLGGDWCHQSPDHIAAWVALMDTDGPFARLVLAGQAMFRQKTVCGSIIYLLLEISTGDCCLSRMFFKEQDLIIL